MKESIGEIIRDSIKKSGFTQEEFAKEMGMTLRNLANLFNKQHIPIDQLIRASKYLKRDFIHDYTEWLYENENILKPYKSEEEVLFKEDTVPYQKESQISFSLTVKGSFDVISKEMTNFIQSVREEADKRGLQLS